MCGATADQGKLRHGVEHQVGVPIAAITCAPRRCGASLIVRGELQVVVRVFLGELVGATSRMKGHCHTATQTRTNRRPNNIHKIATLLQQHHNDVTQQHAITRHKTQTLTRTGEEANNPQKHERHASHPKKKTPLPHPPHITSRYSTIKVKIRVRVRSDPIAFRLFCVGLHGTASHYIGMHDKSLHPTYQSLGNLT